MRAILQYLCLRPDVAFAGRFNRGMMEVRGGRWVQFNTVPGFPDIHGCMHDGRALYIEVKMARGRLTADQKSFLDIASAAGALAFVARSVDDVIDRMSKQ